MGFLDKVKGVRALYESSAAAAPHWARILSVHNGIGPGTSFDLEIHQGQEAPFEVGTTNFVPRGVTPQVGQDVAFRVTVHDDSTHYEILWDQPPQYGAGADPQVPSNPVERLVQSVQPPAGAGGTAGEARLAMARNMLERGLISQADFDRTAAALGSPAAED